MIRIMLDSDKLGDLPSSAAPLLSTYSDLIGSPAALRELQAHHAGSKIVLIDRGMGDPTGLASVADTETGALAPSQLPAWFGRKQRHQVPFLTSYCNRDNLAECDRELQGVTHWRWVATLDGTAVLALPGYTPLRRPAVIQVLGADKIGVHADLSLVYNDSWHGGMSR
jgi:hypothetical protein